jgi:hypothetical protein
LYRELADDRLDDELLYDELLLLLLPGLARA